MKDVTIWIDFKALQHLASSNKNNKITQTSITYYPTLDNSAKAIEDSQCRIHDLGPDQNDRSMTDKITTCYYTVAQKALKIYIAQRELRLTDNLYNADCN